MAFEYPSDAVEEVTRYKFQHHFKGSEMVVAGKCQDQGPDVLLAKVSGQMVSLGESSWSKGAAWGSWGQHGAVWGSLGQPGAAWGSWGSWNSLG